MPTQQKPNAKAFGSFYFIADLRWLAKKVNDTTGRAKPFSKSLEWLALCWV